MSGRNFDVCNGDADGLCALLQLRLTEPGPAELVTGVKRDIALLERVGAHNGDRVLVCDLSMARNRPALDILLARGVSVRYFDHHEPGEVPEHPLLDVHIDLASDVCTSLLVDRWLVQSRQETRFRRWALVGAWGDNMDPSAARLASQLGLSAHDCETLRELGVAINYNAYGETEADLLIAPTRLFSLMQRHADPLAFAAAEPIMRQLLAQRHEDLARAQAVPFFLATERARVLVLPDESWSRRISGSLANLLAGERLDAAHAVITPRRDGMLSVSVRAPLRSPHGTDALCRRFGGAGRAAAGGIDRLPPERLGDFAQVFANAAWPAR